MAHRRSYEWTVEEIDMYGDAQDVTFCESFVEAKAAADKLPKYVIGLVMYVDDGPREAERQYAYVEDGELPVYFPNGYAIPKRYREEVVG